MSSSWSSSSGTCSGCNNNNNEVRYTVSATHRHGDVSARESANVFIDWLQNGHAQDVIASGASWAEVVEIKQDKKQEQKDDSTVVVVQARYGFASQTIFDEYVSHYAPKLKSEGLAKFGPDSGRNVEFHRFSGQLVDAHAATKASQRDREGGLRYSVRAHCATQEARDYFVQWLTNGHAKALIDKGGALWYEIAAEGNADGFTVEALYAFSETDFEYYLNEVAPQLRAESQATFGPGTPHHDNIRFERQRGSRLFTQIGVQ